MLEPDGLLLDVEGFELVLGLELELVLGFELELVLGFALELGFEPDDPLLEEVLDDDGFGLSALEELGFVASPSCATCFTMANDEIFPSGVIRAVIL